MANTTLTVSAEVPSRDLPGTPALVFYDNGDWELAFQGDTDYIAETSPNFLGTVLVIDLIDEIRLIEDGDNCEVAGDRTHLFLDDYTNVGSESELVIGVFADGTFSTMARVQAEMMVAKDTSALHNFVPVVELLEELRSFLSYHRDDMFDEDDPFDLDDDGEGMFD